VASAVFAWAGEAAALFSDGDQLLLCATKTHEIVFSDNGGARFDTFAIPAALEKSDPAQLTLYGHGNLMFVGGPGGLFRSDDKGATWTQAKLAAKGAARVSFGDVNYAVADDKLFTSSDDGLTWKPVATYKAKKSAKLWDLLRVGKHTYVTAGEPDNMTLLEVSEGKLTPPAGLEMPAGKLTRAASTPNAVFLLLQTDATTNAGFRFVPAE
jgi:photosystem II stability/assembly factor-like uncharacterized protein